MWWFCANCESHSPSSISLVPKTPDSVANSDPIFHPAAGGSSGSSRVHTQRTSTMACQRKPMLGNNLISWPACGPGMILRMFFTLARRRFTLGVGECEKKCISSCALCRAHILSLGLFSSGRQSSWLLTCLIPTSSWKQNSPRGGPTQQAG